MDMATRTKAKADKVERDALTIMLDNVYDAALTFTKGEPALVAAIIAAGEADQEYVRRNIIIARMQVSLGYTKAQTIKALDNPERSLPEKNANNAARNWVSLFLKRHEIVTTSKQGGARDRKIADEMDGGEIKFPGKPHVTTCFELQAWIQAQAQTMVDFFALNEEHDTIDCDHGKALWGAAKDFLTSVVEVGDANKASK